MNTFKITFFGLDQPVIVESETEQEALQLAIAQAGIENPTGDIELVA